MPETLGIALCRISNTRGCLSESPGMPGEQAQECWEPGNVTARRNVTPSWMVSSFPPGPSLSPIHPSPLCLPQTFVRAAPALFCAPLTSVCDIFLILRKSTESSGPQQGPVLSNAPAFPHSPAPQAPTPASQHRSELHFDISKAGSWCLSVFPIPLPLPGFTAPGTQ